MQTNFRYESLNWLQWYANRIFFRALYKRNSNAEIFEDTLTPSLIPRQ